MPVVNVRGHVIIESLVLGTNYTENMGPDVILFLFSKKYVVCFQMKMDNK